MKKIIPWAAAAVLALLAGGCDSTLPETPDDTTKWEWTQVAAYGDTGAYYPAAFVVGDKAYVGTGYDFTVDFWEYNPDTNVWAAKTDFPGPARGAGVGFAVGSKGYIGLGRGADGQFSDLWEYDPATSSWTQKAPLPGGARDHAGAFVIGGKAYVMGGNHDIDADNSADLAEVWEYDPAADVWTRKSDLPEAVVSPACFVINGKGYLGTGVLQSNPVTLSAHLWEYDPQSDGWTAKADFPGAARWAAAGFAVNGKGYIGTGLSNMTSSSATVYYDLWQYNPQTNAWAQQTDFGGTPRGAAAAFVIGTRVFIGAGMDSGRTALRTCWRSSPPSGT